MEIPIKTQDKLRRYLINADPFLFNLMETTNKKKRIAELQAMGFLTGYAKGGNPIYSKIHNDLLLEIGITGILERIIIPRVKKLFPGDSLAYLRRCWEQGQTPSLDYFKKQKLYKKHIFTGDEVRTRAYPYTITGYAEPAFIFVQIDSQHAFVERWTVFAGLWFEEIETLLC